MLTCTVESCAMCAGRSCAACDANDLAAPCGHDVVERHLGIQRLVDETPLPATNEEPSSESPEEARVPTKPLPTGMLADRLDVDPADPDSVAHFLETWAQIVRTKRRFSIILQ